MKTIELTRRTVDLKSLLKRSALPEDTTQEISEPTIFLCDGKPIIFYGRCSVDVEPVRRACLSIGYNSATRTSGIRSSSRTFGALPRDPVRKDFTSLSSIAYEHPKETSDYYSLGQHFDDLYKRLDPETHEAQKARVEKILPDWRIRDTVFTTGIINNSNNLKYHFDRGNFKGALSCMITLRRGVSGGCLSFPEFDFRLNLQDSTYLLFDGQSILHGVTPIQKLRPDSYRYTVVYYSLEALLRSKAPEDELKECSRRAVEKYNRRAGLK